MAVVVVVVSRRKTAGVSPPRIQTGTQVASLPNMHIRSPAIQNQTPQDSIRRTDLEIHSCSPSQRYKAAKRKGAAGIENAPTRRSCHGARLVALSSTLPKHRNPIAGMYTCTP